MKYATAIFVLFTVYQAGTLFFNYASHPAVLSLLIVPVLALVFIYKTLIEEKRFAT